MSLLCNSAAVFERASENYRDKAGDRPWPDLDPTQKITI
jgi:hypothetical protein